MNKLKLNLILTIIVSSFFSSKAQVFVKLDAEGLNNGSSWQNAYTNLDSALNKTSTGQIWVAAGIYKPSLDIATPFRGYKTFNIIKKIGLYGGFKGFEGNINERNINNNITVLSGDVGVEGNDEDNTPRVISITGSNIDSNTTIDGFTITKSYYTNGYDYETGAIYISCFGNPVVRNCTITQNFGFYGGGIYVQSSNSIITPLIINNLITNNISFQGAGIYLDYTRARIIGNKIVKNQCIGGFTHLAGGAIKIQAYTSPFIYGNLIDSNYAGDYGGGIANESNYSAIISNNIISNNTSGYGGGIYIDFSPTEVTDNLIINNRCTDAGGGLYVNYSFNTRSINNTIVNNSSERFGGAVFLEDGNMNFINTIIYSNPTKEGKPFNSFNINRGDWYPRFNYCDVEYGKNGIDYTGNTFSINDIWEAGNISDYPKFIDTANLDFKLTFESSCINTGSPDTTSFNLPKTDLAERLRIVDNIIDMGCYEYNNEILPVRLLDFGAIMDNHLAIIKWRMDNNYEADSFELEKSSNGAIFTRLSVIPINEINYTYQDNSLYNGYNYYRLKIWDKENHFFYSSIILVFNGDFKILQLFPNPVSTQLHFTFNIPASSKKLVLKIYSMEAKLLYESSLNSNNAAGTINVEFLSSGIYLFKLSSSNALYQSFFIKK